MIGQTVGNYRITKRLGEGGMGVVYLAEHPGIGRKVAVKVLHPQLTQDAEVANRFFNEARAANAIGHPGIVQVLDFGRFNSGASYIVMEFLEGESLGARLRRGRLRITDAVEIVFQTAAALGAVHAKGIVHRDLKPDNLYLTPDPQTPGREVVKVLDFGIAKLGAGPGGQADSGSLKTRTGAVMGTPVYMSPEQCRGTKEVDHRTDLYALGVILYEMLCGTPPFVSEGQGELIHMHISEPPPPPRKYNPGIPEPLEKLVLRTLEKDPARRFQTMGELQQALKGTPVRTVAAIPIDPLAPTPNFANTTLSGSARVLERAIGRPRRLRVALALGGGAVAAVMGYFAISVGKGPPNSESAVPTSSVVGSVLPPAVPPPATPREPAPVAVELTSEPVGARVVRARDGAVIGLTPLRKSWAASGGVEKLRIEMEGYKTETVVVPLDRGVDLALPLKRIAAQVPRRKRASENASTVPVAPTPATPPTTAPAPAPMPTKPVKAEPLPL